MPVEPLVELGEIQLVLGVFLEISDLRVIGQPQEVLELSYQRFRHWALTPNHPRVEVEGPTGTESPPPAPVALIGSCDLHAEPAASHLEICFPRI